jgi:tRNA dimethylallyltransferase
MGKQRQPPPLLVVLGLTASGKSDLGIALARAWHGEIVSADSRQVYRGLDIGTAKVTLAERALVPHHLIDVVDPGAEFNVAMYQDMALAAIAAITARGALPVLVGGSPHYLQAVLEGLDIPRVPPNWDLRAELARRAPAELLALLRTYDPVAAAQVDPRNARRIVRAIEVCRATGAPYSAQRRRGPERFRTLKLGLNWPRDELYRRIDRRVDARLAQGMIAEVEGLIAQGVDPNWLHGLGLEYRFIVDYLAGRLTPRELMVERLKFAIHRFAREQLGWFRHDPNIIWLDPPGAESEAQRLVSEFLRV